MSTLLRPYQTKLCYEVQKLFALGHRRMVVQLPMGGGKTQIAAELVRRAGLRHVLYIVPSGEILEQTSNKLDHAGVKHITLAAGQYPDLQGVRAVLAMSQTLARRIKTDFFDTWKPDLIFVDEAHKLIEQHRTALSHWNVPVVAFTATPVRLDGKPLATLWPVLVVGPSFHELQKLGWLVPCRTIELPMPNLQGIRHRAGDFDAHDLDLRYAADQTIQMLVECWSTHAKGLRTIAFTSGVESSRKLVAAFAQAGTRARHVDSSTPAQEREDALQCLRQHSIDVICNCALFIEGLDVIEVGAIQCATATESLSRWLQLGGRGLRPAPGKRQLLLLDHGGNARRHDLIDADRDWYEGGTSLEAAKQTCLCCGTVILASANLCTACFRVPTPELGEPARDRVKAEERKSRSILPRPCPLEYTSRAAEWKAFEAARFANGWPLSYPTAKLQRGQVSRRV